MDSKVVLKKLKSLSNPKNVEGMARFGINPENTLGISIPNLRQLAKEIGKNPDFAKAPTGKHELAKQLWDSEIHEARLLACMVDDPKMVSEQQMDNWAEDFDSWDICDQCIMNLFDRTEIAWKKAFEWAKKDDEFVKRAGFAMMASLAVHDKKAPDENFEKFLPFIKAGATDDRNFVKKAVNWALRQIGKRNPALNKKAIEASKEIQTLDSKSAKWVASDALRELTGQAVQDRFKA